MITMILTIKETKRTIDLAISSGATKDATTGEKLAGKLIAGLAESVVPVMAAASMEIELRERLAPFSGKRLEKELEILADQIYGSQEPDPASAPDLTEFDRVLDRIFGERGS